MKIILANQFKNESKRLKEWLLYHKFLGVNDFILVNDHSTDNSKEIIKNIPDITVHLLDSKLKEHTSFKSSEDTEKYMGGGVPQIIFENFINIHDYCLKTYGKNVYLGFFDVDEFIYFNYKEYSFLQIIKKYLNENAVLSLDNFDVDSDRFDLNKGWVTQQTTRSMDFLNKKTTYRANTVKSFQNLNYNNLNVFKELLETPGCHIGTYIHGGGVKQNYVSYADNNELGFLHYRKPMYELHKNKHLCNKDYEMVKQISNEALKYINQ